MNLPHSNYFYSSANRYFVKYINIKENDRLVPLVTDRQKRDAIETAPINFMYRAREENNTARHVVIAEPQVLKEHCVPNITKLCMSMYVICDSSLFANFDETQERLFGRTATSVTKEMWPWIAKIYVEGDYRCTGVLVELSWVLVSQSCLWDSM